MIEFLKELIKAHFGWFAGLAVAALVILVLALVWLFKLARADRKAAKRELYLLVTLKRIFFSKDSPNDIMDDLGKPDTPLDETSLPFKAVPNPRDSKETKP
jgi:hypothetical protein